MNKKILKINLCLIMLFIFISCTAQVFAAGRFSLSKSSSSITEGKTDSFTINGSNATGRVDITSSNTSVATVSSSSKWLENNCINHKINIYFISHCLSLVNIFYIFLKKCIIFPYNL